MQNDRAFQRTMEIGLEQRSQRPVDFRRLQIGSIERSKRAESAGAVSQHIVAMCLSTIWA
jgi:hypothetical protein